MKYVVSITERVNVGNYEFIEHTATVDFEDDEAEGDPAVFARDRLDVLLRAHRRRAQTLVPEDVNSFITEHPALES